MARWAGRANHGAALRAAILSEVEDQMTCTPVIAEMLLGVSKLRSGSAVSVRRWDLPDWCPERSVGNLGDDLVLAESNELVPWGEYCAAHPDFTCDIDGDLHARIEAELSDPETYRELLGVPRG